MLHQLMKRQIDRKSNGDKSESSTGARSVTSDSALELIHARAYSLFEWRGQQPGHALDDWLQAEREILRHRQPPRIVVSPIAVNHESKTIQERQDRNRSSS